MDTLNPVILSVAVTVVIAAIASIYFSFQARRMRQQHAMIEARRAEQLKQSAMEKVMLKDVLVERLEMSRQETMEKQKELEQRHEAQLEEMRRSFESELYRLTDRLMSTEKRWQDINHLLVSAQSASQRQAALASTFLTPFLRNTGLSDEELTIENDKVFVLTPFHPEARNIYDAIERTCKSLELRCLRGDEKFVAGDLFSHIMRELVTARVVVANIDGRNPNVFYELGIAHSLGKPTILISRYGEGFGESSVVFDLQSKQILFYHQLEDLEHRLRVTLTRLLVAKP